MNSFEARAYHRLPTQACCLELTENRGKRHWEVFGGVIGTDGSRAV